MKKLIALLLSLVLILSLGACGKEESSIDDLAKLPEEEAEAPAPEETPAEPSDPVPEAEPEPVITGVTLETPLFTMIYDDTAGWVPDPDASTAEREDYSSMELMIPDPENADLKVARFRVYVKEEGAANYRSSLHSEGFDIHEVAEGALETMDIGGVPMLIKRTDEQYVSFYGRHEASGLSISIHTFLKHEDPALLDTALAGLTFTLPDNGLVDVPYFWDGEPFTTEDHSAMIGTFTVNSVQVPISPCVEAYDIFKDDIEVIGDQAYLTYSTSVHQYSYDGAALTFVQDLPFEDDYEFVEATSDGTLIASCFMSDLVGWKDGAQVFSYPDVDYFAVAPDGTWGLSHFVSGDSVEKVTFSNGAAEITPMPLPVKTLSRLRIDENYIFVTGSSTDETIEGHRVMVFDHNGTLVHVLGDDDGGLGSVTFACKTPNGFLALDGNMREILFWNNDGSYIGKLEDSDLFGTNYPWFCSADPQPDGSILVLLTEERPDETGDELLAFKITGF